MSDRSSPEDAHNATSTVASYHEAVERATQAEEENEVCPECGGDFLDVDMTGDGNLYFIHDEDGMFVDGCEVETEVTDVAR